MLPTEKTALRAQLKGQGSIVSEAAGRPEHERFLTRHLGTEAQLGAWYTTLGGVVYVIFAALQVETHLRELGRGFLAVDVAYLLAAVLWAFGAIILIPAAYPERALEQARLAAADAADGGARIRSLSTVQRNFTGSIFLLGAWGFGMGAPAFMVGSVLQLLVVLGNAAYTSTDVVIAYVFVSSRGVPHSRRRPVGLRRVAEQHGQE